MPQAKSWWRMRRVKHRDAIVLCVLSASFLLAGEFANPVLLRIYQEYLAPVVERPELLIVYALLSIFAFTTAFGVVLVLLGGWYFLRGKVPRGRFLVGLGIGLTSLSFVSRFASYTLAAGSPYPFLVYLTTTFMGLGILFGFAAHTIMGQYALMLKKRATRAWQRYRRSRRPTSSSRSRPLRRVRS